jgi:hypothetical protein
MVLVAGTVFSAALVATSYAVNRWLCRNQLQIDRYQIALTASAVLLLATLAESLIDPWYALWQGQDLWEYRVYPIHHRHVSAFAVLVWTAYGVHLYFTRQSLDLRLPPRWNNNVGKAFVIGFEAPFFFEVTGNLTFLLLSGTYYAYYLPPDVWHLTSVQVIPVYMVCALIGLITLRALERLPRRVAVPATLFAGGILFLLSG